LLYGSSGLNKIEKKNHGVERSVDTSLHTAIISLFMFWTRLSTYLEHLFKFDVLVVEGELLILGDMGGHVGKNSSRFIHITVFFFSFCVLVGVA
jgi:hypothetical protein